MSRQLLLSLSLFYFLFPKDLLTSCSKVTFAPRVQGFHPNNTMTAEDILQSIGGLGRFQIMVVGAIYYNNLAAGWSMLQVTSFPVVKYLYMCVFVCTGCLDTEKNNERHLWKI